MGLDQITIPTAKMLLSNIATGETIEALFNPTRFSESLEVNYARLSIPGLSHQVMQYVNTNNVAIPITLYFDAFKKSSSFEQVLYQRRFLQHLCYPKRGAQTVAGGGTPRALFVWPSFIRLTCVITSLTFQYLNFNRRGQPIRFTADLNFEEIRDIKWFSDDAIVHGSDRPQGG